MKEVNFNSGDEMKKIILIILGLLIVIGAALHFTAPKTFKFERAIVINKPKDIVWNNVVMVGNHLAWNPWVKEDKTIKISTTGTDGSVGYISKWEGNSSSGSGEEEIKNLKEGERIDLEIRFKKPMEGTNASFIALESLTPEQTKVTWNMNGENKFPGTIICQLFDMQKKMEGDFDKGLGELKSILEAH